MLTLHKLRNRGEGGVYHVRRFLQDKRPINRIVITCSLPDTPPPSVVFLSSLVCPLVVMSYGDCLIRNHGVSNSARLQKGVNGVQMSMIPVLVLIVLLN